MASFQAPASTAVVDAMDEVENKASAATGAAADGNAGTATPGADGGPTEMTRYALGVNACDFSQGKYI